MSKAATAAALTEEERAEIIEIGSRVPETTREPDDIERALAVPLRQSNQIEIDGLPFAEAFKHPAIRNALEAYADLIEHSKNDPPEVGWGGIAQFFLRIDCFKAGHPLLAMPAKDVAAEAIRRRSAQHMAPEYLTADRAATRQGLLRLVSTVLVGQTIFENRVLLANAVGIRKSIVSLWSKKKPKGTSPTDFELFTQRLEMEHVESARRYDPEGGASFLTYAYKASFGAAMDWIKTFVGHAPLPADADPDDDGPHPNSEMVALVNRVWGGTGYFGTSPNPGIAGASELPKRESACDADLRGANLRAAMESIAQKADLDRRQRLIWFNMVTKQKLWKDLAREQNISAARMNKLKADTQKKLRPLLISGVWDG